MIKSFEQFIVGCGAYANAEELRSELDKNYRLEERSRQQLLQQLNALMPNGYPSPSEEDVRRRRELTAQMRQSMAEIAEQQRIARGYRNDPEVQRSITPEQFGMIPRQLEEIMSFHCDSPQEYARRANICVHGTPEEKGNLIMETVRPLAQNLQRFRGHMPHQMTPNEIAENFGAIFDCTSLLMELDGITNLPGIELSEDARSELKQFASEFDTSVSAAYAYGKVMAEDYYAEFPPEDFIRNDVQKLVEEAPDNSNEKLMDIIGNVDMVRGMQSAALTSEFKTKQINGFPIGECRRFRANFTPYEGDPDAVNMDFCENLIDGGTAYLQLPDGSFQTLTGHLVDGGCRIHQAPTEPAALNAFLDGDLGPMLDELSRQLEDTRSMFVRDSQEYKDMHAVMKEVRKSVRSMGEHPTSEHLEALQEQMQLLSVTAQAYLNHKEGEKLSSLAQKRVNAVQNILNFSKERGSMLNYAGREKWQEATQQELDMEARGKNLGEWLKGKEPVNPQLNELYKQTLGEFKSFDDPDEWDTYKYQRFERMAGILVADEAIRQEREAFAGTGCTGLVEATAMNNRSRLEMLGDFVLRDITGDHCVCRTPDDNRAAFISLDPKAHMDRVEDGLGGLGYMAMKDMQEINRQYRDVIQPRGAEPDAYEKALAEFVDKNIRTPAASFLLTSSSMPAKDNSTASKAAAADLLRDCVLANMVQMERTSLGKNGPGNLEKMMSDPEKLKQLQQKISAYPDFKNMVKHDVANWIFVSTGITALIKKGEPAQLAREILTKANPEVQKEAGGNQPQLRQNAPAKKPVSPKNPQL